MPVETVIEDARWEALDLPVLSERAVAAVLGHFGLDASAYEIAVMGCDDARIAELNAGFRGKPKATNVLSWPAQERGSAREGAMPEMPAPVPAPQDSEFGDIRLIRFVHRSTRLA